MHEKDKQDFATDKLNLLPKVDMKNFQQNIPEHMNQQTQNQEENNQFMMPNYKF